MAHAALAPSAADAATLGPEQMKARRESLGLSEADVADALLLSVAQVRGIEAGSAKPFYNEGFYGRARSKYTNFLATGIRRTKKASAQESLLPPASQPVPPATGVAAVSLRAEAGDATAQFALGLAYALGRDGVAQDDAAAVAWFRKAAEQGLPKAQFNLGVAYDKGRGVPQDGSQAKAWLHKAAEQGLSTAQFNLGVLYANGRGVTRNYPAAYMWIAVAASRTSGDTQQRYARALIQIAEKLNPQQVEMAEHAAREWQTGFDQRPTPAGESRAHAH